MIISATGHRPDKLGGYGLQIADRLRSLAREYLNERKPDQVISGMALGWDQAWAWAAIDIGIPVVAAVPCPGQEAKWPEASQIQYRRLLELSFRIEVISEFYSARNLQRRNEWMVDNCDEIAALWDGSFGGTCNCLIYADRRKKPVVNLWSRWFALAV